MRERRKCIICESRPVAMGVKAGYCKQCSDQIEAQKRARSGKDEVYKYLTYRGVVIALKPVKKQGGSQMYNAERVFKNPDTLPKGITVNLNQYCEGYDRSQIKKMKALFARCAA
ncbi:MAG: hypothetical protein PHO67_07945 [Candidatus Omnitrophica bacterium]|nr:hypothetical protein [Candidatus Omnitrophota bacterium]